MASATRKSNGTARTASTPRAFDADLGAARRPSRSTRRRHGIARITDDVSRGRRRADARRSTRRSSGVNEMAASLKETAGAGRVGGGVGRGAGLVGQRDGGVDRAGRRPTPRAWPTSVDRDARRRSQRDARVDPVGDRRRPQEMAAAAQQVTTSITEMAASIKTDQPRHRGARQRRSTRPRRRSRRCRGRSTASPATPTTSRRRPRRPRRRSTRWRRRSRRSAR